jgi:DnaJ-class molecular chaperone
MAKDYYLILGVPLDAAPDQIRSAFRKLALRYHPDREGASSPAAFHDISEAYDVLSDPTRRARYDRERRQTGPRGGAEPSVSRANEPEPLVSEPVPVTGQPESVRPSFDALFDRLRRNFLDDETPKAEHAEPLNFELILSPEEAAVGVRIPFEVPVFSICHECGGLGRQWVFPCTGCDGDGRIVDRQAIEVRVPAGVRDGAVLDVSLEALGVTNLWLRVFVRVSAG